MFLAAGYSVFFGTKLLSDPILHFLGVQRNNVFLSLGNLWIGGFMYCPLVYVVDYVHINVNVLATCIYLCNLLWPPVF